MTIHHLHAEEATDVSQFFQIHPENPQARLIKQAVEIIRNGGVVVYPTDSYPIAAFDGQAQQSVADGTANGKDLLSHGARREAVGVKAAGEMALQSQ